MTILESFEIYCSRHGITSEQYKEEIFPVFAAGYVRGAHDLRKGIKENDHLIDKSVRNYHPYSDRKRN